jgi:hypothetical protein
MLEMNGKNSLTTSNDDAQSNFQLSVFFKSGGVGLLVSLNWNVTLNLARGQSRENFLILNEFNLSRDN